MNILANLIGILSIPVYYVVLVFILDNLFFAGTQLATYFGVLGLFVLLPVSVMLSIWFGHMTCRFLLRRWCMRQTPWMKAQLTLTRDHEGDTLQPPPNDLPL